MKAEDAGRAVKSPSLKDDFYDDGGIIGRSEATSPLGDAGVLDVFMDDGEGNSGSGRRGGRRRKDTVSISGVRTSGESGDAAGGDTDGKAGSRRASENKRERKAMRSAKEVEKRKARRAAKKGEKDDGDF